MKKALIGYQVYSARDDAQKDLYGTLKALKEMGYDKYVSFECGTDGDRTVTVPAAVALLREQWQKA